MTLVLAALLALGISLPHALRLRRVASCTASFLWLSSLALRAVAGLLVVTYLLLCLPSTGLFQALAHWCWHTVLPVLASHLGLDGHRIAGAATVLPGLLVAASVLSGFVGVLRAARSVRHIIRRHAVGTGPRDSVIVGGEGVILAAAGLRRPRVLVSAGALITLDDAELAAGLDHELGHIARRHRYLLLLAQLFHAIGRFIPGSRRAVRELAFHLERDADRWAIARCNDPHALAGVISKAAGDHALTGRAAMASLAGAGVVERLRQLVDDTPARPQSGATALRCVSVVMVALTIGVGALVPMALASRADGPIPGTAVRHCAS